MNRRDTKTKQDGMDCSLDGKAGEYAVASQLLRRKMAVLWPTVDTGYDLMAANGCRIQVKTTHRLQEGNKANYPPGAYWFALPKVKNRATATAGKIRVVPRPKFSDVCDVVAFFGMEDDRYWILPAKLCDGVSAFVMGFENPRRFSGDINELRELNKNGMSHEKIAEKFNCHRVTVTRLINSDKDYQKKSNFEIGRRSENAWEHILDFGLEKDSEPVTTEVLEEVNGEQLV